MTVLPIRSQVEAASAIQCQCELRLPRRRDVVIRMAKDLLSFGHQHGI